MTHKINSQVTVTSLGFKKNFASYPRSIEYMGTSYRFIDSGIRCQIVSGAQIIVFLTMTDGVQTFHLRSESRGGTWTLIGMN